MRNIDSVNTYRSTISRLRHGPTLEKAVFLQKLTADTDAVLKAHIDNIWPTGNKIVLSWIITTIVMPLAVYFLSGLDEYDEPNSLKSTWAGLAAIASTGIHLFALWYSYDKNTQKPYNRDKLDRQFIERPNQLLSSLLTFIQNIYGINSDIESKKEVSLKIFDANDQSKVITDKYLNTHSSIDANRNEITRLEIEIAAKTQALKQSTAPPAYQETKTSAAETASAADPEMLVLMQQQAKYLDTIFEKNTSKSELEAHLEKNKGGLTPFQIKIINLKIELLDHKEIHPELVEALAENAVALNQLFDRIAANNEVIVSSIRGQDNRYGTFSTHTLGENERESSALLAPK